MKRQYAIPMCAVMLALGSAAVVRAADYGSPSAANPSVGSPSAAPSNPAASPTDMKALTGTVQNVDPAKKSVDIVDDTGKVQTLKVDAGTQISRDGNTIQLAQLKKGDIVTIRNANSTM